MANPFTDLARRKRSPEVITTDEMKRRAGYPVGVEINIRRKHKYKKKPDKPGNKKPSPGCAICDLRQYHHDHIGAPPSLNALGDGNRFMYRDIKESYEEAITLALEASDLPKNCNRIDVQCMMGFEDLRGRDEGNFRFIPEKALGDVLQRLGYLPDDTFYPVKRYHFDNIDPVHDKGKSWVKLLLFPS